MASLVYYKFKSYKDFSTINFEGTHLPMWELKYEVITQRKMISKDFDLLFFDEETSEQLLDEYFQIPRNSHIVIQRIPSWMSKTGLQLKERRPEQAYSAPKKYFKDPPENYVCFRCNNKGHFIQHCPTNNDKSFDIQRIRKPSGIPKDFLRKLSGDAEGAGIMLVADSGYVVANPQTHEWTRQGEKYSQVESIPDELKCALCNRLLKEAMISQCGHRFCESCMVSQEKCHVCNKKITDMTSDEEYKRKVKRFKETNEY